MKRTHFAIRTVALFCTLLLLTFSFSACSSGKDDTEAGKEPLEHKVWGLEIYVFERAENDFCCGILPGSADKKSLSQIFSLWEDALSVVELSALLQNYAFEDEQVCLVYFQHPLSSYVRMTDDTFSEQVSALFDNRFPVVSLESVCDIEN